MNSYDRVMTAAMMQEPDRVPVLTFSNHMQIKLAGYKFSECLEDGNKFIVAQVEALNRFGYDGVTTIGGAGTISEALGAELIIPEDESPSITKPLIHDSYNLDNLLSTDIKNRGRIPFYLDVTQKLKQIVGPKVPVVASISSPFYEACMLRGLNNFFKDLLRDPPFIKDLVEILVESCIGYGQACIEAGADILAIPSPCASGSMIAKEQFKEFVHPNNEKLITTLQKEDIKVMLYASGNWDGRFDLAVEEGADIYQIDKINEMDLSEIKNIYGQKVCLMGRVSTINTLLKGTPEEVYQESLDCIKKGGPGGGYILAGDGSLSPDTPVGNLEAMVKVAQDRGHYPLDFNSQFKRYNSLEVNRLI